MRALCVVTLGCQVCINGKPSLSSVANSIFCDDNIEVQVGQWQQISIDVYDRLQVLFTAKALTTSFVPNTDLPGADYSVTSVTYDGMLTPGKLVWMSP